MLGGSRWLPPLLQSPKTVTTDRLITTSPSRLILPFQRDAFAKLCAIARACFGVQRASLPIKPRTNTLIIGPSGSGKSHLARNIGIELGLPTLSVSIFEWIPLGCSNRGSVVTWRQIQAFLFEHRHKPGVIIFVDEICKLGTASWDRYVLTEALKFLDLQIPSGLAEENGDLIGEYQIEECQKVLSNRTLILGGGAFQWIWEERGRVRTGFKSEDNNDQLPDLNVLSAALPRELMNRFRSDIVILPPLQESDYEEMLMTVAPSIPEYLRQTFLRMGLQMIPSAFRCRQGCRFLEELLLDVVIEERKNMTSLQLNVQCGVGDSLPSPPPDPHPRLGGEPDC